MADAVDRAHDVVIGLPVGQAGVRTATGHPQIGAPSTTDKRSVRTVASAENAVAGDRRSAVGGWGVPAKPNLTVASECRQGRGSARKGCAAIGQRRRRQRVGVGVARGILGLDEVCVGSPRRDQRSGVEEGLGACWNPRRIQTPVPVHIVCGDPAGCRPVQSDLWTAAVATGSCTRQRESARRGIGERGRNKQQRDDQ